MNAYLADRNPRAARRMEDRIRQRAREIAQTPLSAPALGVADLRRALVSRTPYALIFQVRGADVIVVAVMHQSQNS